MCNCFEIAFRLTRRAYAAVGASSGNESREDGQDDHHYD